MKRVVQIACISIFIVMSVLVCSACHSNEAKPVFSEAELVPSHEAHSAPQLGAGAAQPPATVQPPPQPNVNAGPVLSGGIVLPHGLLPDGAYSPLAAPERYYAGAVHEFIPSAVYGRIWPYIGGYIPSMMGTWSELIGVCDDNGRIICDPAYNDVALIENGGFALYAFTTYSVDRDDGRYEDRYMATLAPLDGSWAETYERVIWAEKSSYEFSPPIDYYEGYSREYQWRNTINYDFITAKRGGRWGVIGWDGNVLLPFVYLEPVCFHEGVAAVLSEGGETYNFIDITGRIVLGPFETPPKPKDEWSFTDEDHPRTAKIVFYEGCAKFYRDGKFGIIDMAGNIIVPAMYDFITCMSGGMAMFIAFPETAAAQPPFERFGIINSSGDVIVAPTDYNYRYYYPPYIKDGQVVVLQMYNPVGDIIYYDGTRSPYEDRSPHYSSDGDFFIFSNSDVALPALRKSFEYINDDLIVVSDWENWTWRIYDYEGVPVSPERSGVLHRSFYNGRSAEYLFIDMSPPGVWEWPPPVMLYGLDGNAAIAGTYYTVTPIGDKYLVRGKSTAGLVDADGRYIIKVGISAYGAD